ncbi:FH1/FH2 domain-containing protein 3-like, partial [Acipenser ruthenus]|uniref:FH1/FH2 domain-containing protein 3-like n=1 Tax=Acipenser ruthenus TaxID=7906 RepID=UPI00274113F3
YLASESLSRRYPATYGGSGGINNVSKTQARDGTAVQYYCFVLNNSSIIFKRLSDLFLCHIIPSPSALYSCLCHVFHVCYISCRWFLFTCCLARFLSSLPPPPLLVPPYFNHREEENEEEEEEQPITEPNTEDEGEEEPSRQVKHSVVSQSPVIDNVEQANAIYSPKYVANIIPISEEDRPLNNPTAKNSPATSPRATGSTDRPNSSHLYVSPPPSVLTSLLANRRSPTTTSRTGCQGSSANITPAVSPTVEKLPYLPHSPFHLFSYDFDEPSPSTVKETEAEAMRSNSQADATCSSKYSDSNDPYSSRYSSGRYNSYGSSSSPYTSSKSYSTLSAPTTPTSRYGTSVSPSPDSKTDRPVLGGLLTSSYRQHQESLAAERERRRQEREERLLRIEREERNKFNRDYMDKREEQKHAREERYKNVERLAAEEYEKERSRTVPRGRSELTLSLSPHTASTSPVPRCVTPSSAESRRSQRHRPLPMNPPSRQMRNT